MRYFKTRITSENEFPKIKQKYAFTSKHIHNSAKYIQIGKNRQKLITNNKFYKKEQERVKNKLYVLNKIERIKQCSSIRSMVCARQTLIVYIEVNIP